MGCKHLLTEKRNHIIILTLNRHEARDAINHRLRSKISDAMEQF